MQPTHPPALPEASTRLLLPASRYELPRWEVSYQGLVVGWIHERHHHALIFFEAIGIDNITREPVGLELDTDFAARVEVVRRFWLDPASSRQHLPRRLRQVHGLE